MLDLQPTLHGALVDLRPLRADDFEALHRAASDPLIWEQHPEPDRHQREVFQRFFDSGLASRGALVILDRRSGRLIGSSRYNDYRPAEREVEVGYTFLERACWGGDYNGEVKRLMLGHAFTEVERVLFIVGEHNHRSQKAVGKLGAVPVRDLLRPGRDGRPQRSLVFALDRGTFVGPGGNKPPGA